MPITTPAMASRTNEAYPIISVFRTDTELVPYFNPSDSGVMILPGEPFIRAWGAGQRVFLAQGRIEEGKIGHVRTRWTADFPCILTADVVEGTAIYWDISVATADNPVGVAKIAGDVTNGFLIGYASFVENAGVTPDVNASDLVICGTTESTTIRVVYDDVLGTAKGTVSALSEMEAPTLSVLQRERRQMALKANQEKGELPAKKEAKEVEPTKKESGKP